jgi:hypothetical protein
MTHRPTTGLDFADATACSLAMADIASAMAAKHGLEAILANPLYISYRKCPITKALAEVIDDLLDAADDLAEMHGLVYAMPVPDGFPPTPPVVPAKMTVTTRAPSKGKATVPLVITKKSAMATKGRKPKPAVTATKH